MLQYGARGRFCHIGKESTRSNKEIEFSCFNRLLQVLERQLDGLDFILRNHLSQMFHRWPEGLNIKPGSIVSKMPIVIVLDHTEVAQAAPRAIKNKSLEIDLNTTYL